MSSSRTAMRASRRPASRPIAAAAIVTALAASSLAAIAPAHALPSAPTTPQSDNSPTAARRLNPTESASAQAKATGEPVTVDQLTDTSTQVVANPDGTFTWTDSSMPQRVQQQGKWVPINTTLVQQTDGTWAPKAAVTQVAFSDGGSGALVTMRSEGDKLGFSWPGTLPKPVVAKDTATYPEVLPGVDLQLTADASGYSSILVVKTAKAAADPRLRSLALNTTSTSLKLASTSNGGAQATDKHTGKTVFHSDTALMWDSAGQKTSGSTFTRTATASAARAEHTAAAKVGTHRAQVHVALKSGKQLLGLDQSLLTAKTTRYPVYVDPEWSGRPSQLDWARISDNGWNVYNSTSTTGATNAREGWDNNTPGNGERARTYYQINTGGIKGAVVSHASLYVKQLSAASCADTPAAVYGTDRPAGWGSSSLYWGHEPGGRTGALGTNPKSHEAGTCPVTDGSNSHVSPPSLEFDVTSRAQSAAAGGWSSMTLMVQSPDMNDASQWKQFAYGGGATMSVTYSYRPKLKNGTGTPAIKPSIVSSGKTMTTTHTPTLSARAVDPDLAGGSELLRVDYQIFNSSGTMIHQGYGPNLDSKKRARYNTNGSDWTTPSLPDGTYTWKATAQNAAGYWAGTGSGIWTKTQTFTVDTSAPPAPTVTSSQFPAKQIGSAFGDQGTFVLGNNHTNNVTGYLFSLDATLSSTVYTSSGVTHLVAGTKIAQGKIYYATADNGPGTGTSAINGSASPVFAPGSAGPHTLYAKAVDQAGSTSISQTAYAFYAGTSTPTYAYGDKMISGWTATNTDGTTTVVPKATTTSTGGQVVSQPAHSGYEFADGYQAMLGDKSITSKVLSGDSATFSFDIPKAGPWGFGVNLTKAKDYGIYRLVLDAGASTQSTLISGFDAYNAYTTTQFLNLGIPKDTNGQLLSLKQGVHTLTLTVSGKNPSSAGYQAGIDVLRLAPALTCAINSTGSCLNNTATSTFTTTTSAADADGSGNSINSADLTSTSGWQSSKTVTVDGATVTLPKFGTGTYDNMLASGQTVTLPGSGVVNTGDAVVFLAFATGGAAKGAAGTITYAKNNCLDPNGAPYNQDYRLDTVPDWLTGPASAASVTLVHENHSNNTQTSPSSGPKVYAISVPLQCPGSVISSISLPLFSNGVQAGQPSLHILGLGVRPMAVTGSGTSAQHWVGTWSSVQDTAKVLLSSGGTATVNGQTLRIPAHVSVGSDDGNGVRIHLSNAMGNAPVTFDAASVALQDTTAGGATAGATPTALTFGTPASTSVTIPAGGDVTSNPVTLTVAQQATLLVSLQVHGSASVMPGHGAAQTPVWVSDAANRAGDTGATNYTQTTYTGLPYLAGIDVTTPTSTPTGSLVLYGDQSVNGDTASGDGQHHLSDAFTDALVNDPVGDNSVDYGVLNAGTNSSSLSNNLLPQITNSSTPQSALNPVDRNVLTQGNVRTVLVSTGATDLLNCTGDANTCATSVESELAVLNSQLSAYYTDDSQSYDASNNPITQNANITVYLATIPPFTSAHPGTATQEAAREQLNSDLINNYPGQVIDFASAVSTDGTATSSTVKAADLSNGSPANAYYADLAALYVSDIDNDSFTFAPNLVVPLATGSDTPEDDWQLDTDGTDSQGDNMFTAVGGAALGAEGPDAVNAGSGSASFDGSTGFLESDHTAVNTLGDYTVSAWVKINSATSATAICQGTSEHQAFYLGYDSGNKGWMFQTTTTNDATADFPTAEGDTNTGAVGTWAHLLVTYTAPVDGDSNTGVMSIYQNGSLMGTAANLTPQYDSSMPLTIGGCVNSVDTTTPYSAFPGSVADVHVYPYAMEPSQASATSVIVPTGWENGMPEDEWKLAANGSDTATLNPFTASGSATFGTDGPSGAAGSIAFDGSTGFLKSKQSAVNTLGDYTISTWVKINSALGTTAVCQGTTQHQAFYLSYDKASSAWMFQTTTTNDENADFPTAEGDNNSAPVGTWTHLVAAFRAPVAGSSNTGNMALYQNGTLVGTATNLSPQYDSSMPLTVGGCVNSASATTPYLAFPGSVADVHVYPRTLSASEVAALH
ncbi:LamG-like jellyroll fold domain-containing protein [Streptomyces sp. NBC_00696]|uniref:LamG-like jellyroll fold domain-containing protein n=1 Tax=Streptomyces sp. NBC_00696 TaxID=2903672 RepID=UPI002E2FB8AD|nr:LamG-like jellyroll fold domain-containing protein [Streptomyces sp. NBC_00696]